MFVISLTYWICTMDMDRIPYWQNTDIIIMKLHLYWDDTDNIIFTKPRTRLEKKRASTKSVCDEPSVLPEQEDPDEDECYKPSPLKKSRQFLEKREKPSLLPEQEARKDPDEGECYKPSSLKRQRQAE